MPLHLLCVSRFFKGVDFLRAVRAEGHHVYLLTSAKLRDEPWPWDAIDETFFMDEDSQGRWNMDHVIDGIAYKMRSTRFDRFVSLDDFDVENTARMREHFRVPGMGQTTARYFRDKLAMRIRAREAGIPVPAFTPLFNDAEIAAFTATVPPPWLIKPRSSASARGIKKLHSVQELWDEVHRLGDERHRFLVERFAPGDVYHVDALSVGGEVVFVRANQYLDTPFDVAHGGGIFRSCSVAQGSPDDVALRQLNADVLRAFGMQYSASHTEFIRGREDGRYYFLETSSRVGGANIAEMVEAASGVNLWAEWARIEIAMAEGKPYSLPPVRDDYAGIIVSLSRYEYPDLGGFADPEVVWRMHKAWHLGLIVQSPDRDRVLALLDAYTQCTRAHFHASLPPEGVNQG
ncbi:MAG: ATPase [Bacteroidia bacterium]